MTTIIIDGDITAIEGDPNDVDNTLFDSEGEFYEWSNLETVEYNGTTPFRVGNGTFNGCSSLSSFPFEYVSSVGNDAFVGTAFTSIDLSGITGNVGKYAFCKLTSLEELKIHVVGEDILFDDESFSAYYSSNSPLESIEISGRGSLFLGPQTVDQTYGNAFSYYKNLKYVDFSDYYGEVSFGNSAFAGDSGLEKIEMGDNAKITYVGTSCFFGCELDSTVLDFSKITGVLSRMSFMLPSSYSSPNPIDINNVKSLDLSNVKEIATYAFYNRGESSLNQPERCYDNITSLNLSNIERIHPFSVQRMKYVDWDAANMPEDAKLAYNDVFAANDNIWAKIIEIMDGNFYLDSDGYDSEPLEPSDNDWEDSHLGDKNDVVNDSTQLTKAAKWTDKKKTEAEVEIQFSYAPKEQMDFLFVLDTSTSMAEWIDLDSQYEGYDQYPSPDGDAQYAKMYELQSKVVDITEKLLTCDQLDTRVGIVAFGSGRNFLSEGSAKLDDVQGDFLNSGFYTKDDVDKIENDIRYITCKGNTLYYMGLNAAQFYVYDAATSGRDITVIFVSDEESLDETHYGEEGIEKIQKYSNYIKNPDPDIGWGKDIYGIMYKEKPTEDDMKYINMACSEGKVYNAHDTDEFNKEMNRIIYKSLNSFTLVDEIGEDFEAVTIDDIELYTDAGKDVSPGTATLSNDGRTITWTLDEPVPFATYTMIISQKLKQLDNGKYPVGDFDTNLEDVLLFDRDSADDPVNQVETPVLSRTENDKPGTELPEKDPDEPDDEPKEDDDPNKDPDKDPEKDPEDTPDTIPGDGTDTTPDDITETTNDKYPPVVPTPDSAEPGLPQTGQNWWAIWIMASAGVILVLLGTSGGKTRYRGRKRRHHAKRRP